MISRVAEHCLWMSRYLERAENTARILEVNQTLLLDFDVPLEQQWKPVLIISGIHNMPGDPDAERVQHYLTWEADNLSSIVCAVNAARENARIIREVISADMWERLNHYYLWLQSPAARRLYEQSRSDFYNEIKRINQLFHGITDSTMSHGEAWEFIQLGKYLERACQTARILDVKYHILLPTPEDVGTPVDNAHWVAILTSCSGYEPFHKQHRTAADPGLAVPDFLIFDPVFPRSVRHCLRQCQLAAHAISSRPLSQPANEVEYLLNGLVGWLHLIKINDFVQAGLHEALTSVINRIHEIGDAIHRTYFDVHLQTPQPSSPTSAGAASLAPEPSPNGQWQRQVSS
jgi:uncharacterized alpha-E superfamily protein